MKALGDLLVQSAMLIHYPAEDSEDIMTALASLLEENGYVKESFAKAALTREQSMPTGLPLGGDYNAAIPHTDIEHVLKAGVALATLKNPVSFRNMGNPEEEVKASLVFLLALDQPKSQITMLQEIASVLQNPDLIQHLMQAEKPEEIIQLIQSNS